MSKKTERRHPFLRGWLVVILVGAMAGTTACSGSGQTGSPATTSSGTTTAGVSFDPPTAFDLTRSVSLTQDEALHGRLHDTTFYSVNDASLHALDLTNGQSIWSYGLSVDGTRPDYLGPPTVVDGTVVVATGKSIDDSQRDNYAVQLSAVDAATGESLWKRSVPIYSLGRDAAEDVTHSPPETWFVMNVCEYEGALLVSVGPLVSRPTTLLLDLATGEVRWQAGVHIVAMATGRYAVGSGADHGYKKSEVLDLQTGQLVAALSDPSSSTTHVVDPYGDETYTAVKVRADDSTESFLRISSIDGSVEPFVPADDDIRYKDGYTCTPEAGRSVLLCLLWWSPSEYGVSSVVHGVSSTSGEVLWSFDQSKMDHKTVTQFHGNVYGMVDDEGYATVELDSGTIIRSEPGLRPLDGKFRANVPGPIEVNEFGALGMKCIEEMPCASREYVWVPASG